MSKSSMQDAMHEIERSSRQEAVEYIKSLDFGEPEESDATDSHEQTSFNNIKIGEKAEEASVHIETKTSCNDTFLNAPDADPH